MEICEQRLSQWTCCPSELLTYIHVTHVYTFTPFAVRPGRGTKETLVKLFLRRPAPPASFNGPSFCSGQNFHVARGNSPRLFTV